LAAFTSGKKEGKKEAQVEITGNVYKWINKLG
jgi:hypothetical protein